MKFQGIVSDYKELHNGMPEGGILCPFLFNMLMENIAKLALPKNVKIFIFADDITVVVTGNNQLMDAQEALNTIKRECCRLGLKINPTKTKAMAVKDVDLGGCLTLEQQTIEWVRHHQCLGIWINSKLSFQKRVEYLRERTSARLAPMKHITTLPGGANYHVLRSFYIHAIRPIIEYSSPALANLTDTQIRSLEVAQNNALRLILGAPMWTRLCNLQMECNIPPLYSRITALNAPVIARALSQPRDAPFVNRVKFELRRNPNFPIPNTWLAGMGRAARKCNLCEELLSRKSNSLIELYRGRAPWEEFPATFNFTELPNSKANCKEQQLKGAAEEAMRKVYTEGCTEYFTDGSVDNSIPAMGAGGFFDALHRILETIKHLLDSTNRAHSHSKSFRILPE